MAKENGREPFIQFDPRIDDTSLVIELEEEEE